MLDTIKAGLEFWDSTNLVLALCGIFFLHEIAVYYTESGLDSSAGIVWFESPLIYYLQKIREYSKENKSSRSKQLYQEAISHYIKLDKFKSMIVNASSQTRFIIPRFCGWMQLFIISLIFAYPYYIIIQSPQFTLFLLLFIVSFVQISGAIYCNDLHFYRYKNLRKTLKNCKIIFDIDNKINFMPYELTQIPLQNWCNVPFAHYVNQKKSINSQFAMMMLYLFKPLCCMFISVVIMISKWFFPMYCEWTFIGCVLCIILCFDILNRFVYKRASRDEINIPICIYMGLLRVFEQNNTYSNLFMVAFVVIIGGSKIYSMMKAKTKDKCIGQYYIDVVRMYWIFSVWFMMFFMSNGKSDDLFVKILEIMMNDQYVWYRIFSLYSFYILFQFELVKTTKWTRKGIILFLMFAVC